MEIPVKESPVKEGPVEESQIAPLYGEPLEGRKGDPMSIKEYLPLIALGGIPIVVVPLLAIMVFKDHLYWATGVGLALGVLLGVLLVSGLIEYHKVLLEEKKENAEHATNVREAVKGGEASEIAVVNMQKLDEYYVLSKNQARSSFYASIGAVCLGFIAILIAARFAANSSQAIVGSLAGVVLNFIGGAFFVMYNKSLQQLNMFYGKLVQLQDTMLAIQQCDKLSGETGALVRQNIILELIQRPAQIQEVTAVLRKRPAKLGGKKVRVENLLKPGATSKD